jgi:hypothetical protein
VEYKNEAYALFSGLMDAIYAMALRQLMRMAGGIRQMRG